MQPFASLPIPMSVPLGQKGAAGMGQRKELLEEDAGAQSTGQLHWSSPALHVLLPQVIHQALTHVPTDRSLDVIHCLPTRAVVGLMPAFLLQHCVGPKAASAKILCPSCAQENMLETALEEEEDGEDPQSRGQVTFSRSPSHCPFPQTGPPPAQSLWQLHLFSPVPHCPSPHFVQRKAPVIIAHCPSALSIEMLTLVRPSQQGGAVGMTGPDSPSPMHRIATELTEEAGEEEELLQSCGHVHAFSPSPHCPLPHVLCHPSMQTPREPSVGAMHASLRTMTFGRISVCSLQHLVGPSLESV